MDSSLLPSTSNIWVPTYHTIWEMISILKLVSCLLPRQWVISRLLGEIHMLMFTVNTSYSKILWWVYSYKDMKHDCFVQHSRTSWKYFYSANQDGYWEFLCSKWMMTTSADRISKRYFTIFRVLITLLQIGGYFLLENLFHIHHLIGLEKWCWQQVPIIWGQNKEVAHNITIKIPSWATSLSYSKKYMKVILILGMEPWIIGSTKLVMTDIGTNLFDAYYNRAKNYQPGLKPGTDKDKVVGIKLGQIMFHLQLLHHTRENNLLLFTVPTTMLQNTFPPMRINRQQHQLRLYCWECQKNNVWLNESIGNSIGIFGDRG